MFGGGAWKFKYVAESLTEDTPSASVRKRDASAEVEMDKKKWTKEQAEGVTEA